MGSESEELFGGGKNVRANFDDAMQISSVRGQITLLRPFLKTPIPLAHADIFVLRSANAS